MHLNTLALPLGKSKYFRMHADDEQRTERPAEYEMRPRSALMSGGQAQRIDDSLREAGVADLRPSAGWRWERYGQPMRLLWSTFRRVSKEIGACIVIIMAVFQHNSHNLMSCNREESDEGFAQALVCEWTKTHVRCFPLLALVASLIVANHLLLRQRAYYEMLKQGLVLDFERFDAWRDPLFLFLWWVLVNAFGHFVFEIWRIDGQELTSLEGFKNITEGPRDQLHAVQHDKLIGDVQRLMAFYFLPALMYMHFLWTSYDVERSLVPLSKYLKDNMDAARAALQRATVVEEATTSALVSQGLSFEGRGGQICSMEVVLAELTERHNSLSDDDRSRLPRLSKSYLLATKWPAHLLLDPRLEDNESAAFRKVWHGYCLVAVVLGGYLSFTLVMQMVNDIHDVSNGHSEDVVALMVEAWCLLLMAYLFWEFVSMVLIIFVKRSTLIHAD
eukprot:TRINITY_DN51618_c0_g1_i1.p1 TRINITY_DN51618_c0_g1~~TRINITY_DN51618_c0_g1_i1.p1  ORF type:complete len:460 (+),score=89.15 TRINITY_DN51618_c0_g1_i1:43-1380(+)